MSWSPEPELDVAALQELVGVDHVLIDPELRSSYERDWTGRFVGQASAVVRPGSCDEVAAVLAWCSDHGVAVVPQGGNTGLVGGGVPTSAGEVVLSLRRLASLAPVDAEAGQLTAGAGVPLELVQEAAHRAGWAFGVDLAARGTATIGGMVATNAGGINVVRWGAMRAQVLGVEAVLADGRVVRHLDGLVKDNTGYDLPGLLTGSEGTLAVVTAARLRLVAPVREPVTAVVACTDVADAVALASEVRRRLPTVLAIEAVWRRPLELVAERLGVRPPFEGGLPAVAVLVEVDAATDDVASLAEIAGNRPAVVADDPAGRHRVWQLREHISEAIAMAGVPHKLDVTLPLSRVARFADLVEDALACWDVHLFGHLGDGNVHVNVLGPDADDEEVDDIVLRLVAQLGGSISAEHGIGRAKRRWLALNRSPEELAAFRAIKAAFDPVGILNPGVLLP